METKLLFLVEVANQSTVHYLGCQCGIMGQIYGIREIYFICQRFYHDNKWRNRRIEGIGNLKLLETFKDLLKKIKNNIIMYYIILYYYEKKCFHNPGSYNLILK